MVSPIFVNFVNFNHEFKWSFKCNISNNILHLLNNFRELRFPFNPRNFISTNINKTSVSECLICTIDYISYYITSWSIVHIVFYYSNFCKQTYRRKFEQVLNFHCIFVYMLYSLVFLITKEWNPPPHFFFVQHPFNNVSLRTCRCWYYNCTWLILCLWINIVETLWKMNIFFLNVIIWYTMNNILVVSFLLFELIELFYHRTPVRLVCFRIILMSTWYQHFLSPFSMHIK